MSHYQRCLHSAPGYLRQLWTHEAYKVRPGWRKKKMKKNKMGTKKKKKGLKTQTAAAAAAAVL